MRYLKDTSNICLVYGSNDIECGLIGYADSDYGGDLVKRRSLTCYIFTFHGCVISWKVTLHPIVSLSTIEAEYMSLIEGVKEGIWLLGLIDNLGLNVQRRILYCDSQSELCLAKNPIYHERSKHIDVRLNFIRDVIENKLFFIEKISTIDNLTDMLTKPLSSAKFKHNLDLVNVRIT